MSHRAAPAYAGVVQEQVQAAAQHVGVTFPASAFSDPYSVDAPVTLTTSLRLTPSIEQKTVRGRRPVGAVFESTAEAARHLEGLLRQAIISNQFSEAASRAAIGYPTRLVAPGGGSVPIGDLADEASTVATCTACNGQGATTCRQCSGSTKVVCTACRGSKSHSCSDCGGSGKAKCYSCGGSGSHLKNREGNFYSESCTACAGYGTYGGCTSCGGRGRRDCGTCSGRGQIGCGGCSGRGSVQCEPCGGERELTTCLKAKVSVSSSGGTLTAADSSLTPFLASCLGILCRDVRFKPSLTALSGSQTSYQAGYSVVVPIGGVSVKAAGKAFRLFAVGPSMSWTSNPAIADALVESFHATLKETRSASLKEIPKLVGESPLATSLLASAAKKETSFAGTLPRGLSRAMANQLQAEVTRLWKGARSRQLSRRALVTAPFVLGGAGFLGWRAKVDGEQRALLMAEDQRRRVEAARIAAEKLKVLQEAASARLIRTIKGFADWNQIRTLAFSPDGRLLVAGCHMSNERQTNLKLWEVASGREIPRFAGLPRSINAVAFSADARSILVATDAFGRGGLTLWDAASGRQSAELTGHRVQVKSAVFTRDGRSIVSGDGDGGIRVWAAGTGRLAHSIDPPKAAGFVISRQLNVAAVSPDNRHVIIGGGFVDMRVEPPERTMRLVDLTTGSVIHDFAGYTAAVGSAQFTADGRHAVIGGNSNVSAENPLLVDVQTGQVFRKFARTQSPGAWEGVSAMTLTPDGRLVLAGDREALSIWSFDGGAEVTCLHARWVKSIAVAPGGQIAATGNASGEVNLWRLSGL